MTRLDDDYRAALGPWGRLGAQMRRLPCAVRLPMALVYTIPYALILLVEPQYAEQMPYWYQDTLIEVGDALLRAARRLRRTERGETDDEG